LRAPKKALGSVTAGCIPIWRGSTATPLREAPEGSAAVLCEGIEDALAIALLAPELRVLAVVSLANMASVELPASIATVILAADNDAPDSPAALALQRALDTHAAAGREVRVARSPTGKDFADALAASTKGDA
jgi:DNA primase